MALTVTNDTGSKGVERISRNYGILTGAVLFDASYPTGGELVTDISKYFKTLLVLQFESHDGYLFEFDKTNNKVIVRTPTNVSDQTPTADIVAAAADQVANTTDLSGIAAAKFIAIGLI